MSAYYFGCWDSVGHGLHATDGYSAGFNSIGPFDRIDGELVPKAATSQGAASLHHRDGWTALAMHDYSVDHRPGSNSVFIFDDALSFDEAVQRARDAFPAIIARIRAAGPITDLGAPIESPSGWIGL